MIKKREYKSKGYLGLARMYAYIEQFRYVEEKDTILEVGNAGGVFKEISKKIAYYKSIDIDPDSNPDFIYDLSNLEEKDKKIIGKYKKVFCCEVLEHIKFEKLESSFKNLLDLSNDLVIVSIPDNRKYIRLSFGVNNLLLKRVMTIPFTGDLISIKNHKYHFYEICNKNAKKIISIIQRVSENNGYQMIRHYRFFDRPYQHFFIFKKNK